MPAGNRRYLDYLGFDFEVFPAGATYCTDEMKFGVKESPHLSPIGAELGCGTPKAVNFYKIWK